MRWREMRQSGNIEDRRGQSPGFRMGGMGGGGFRTGGLGIGGLLLLLVLGWLFGADPMTLLDGGGANPGYSDGAPTGAPSDEAGQMVAAVLGDTEDTWTSIFSENGLRYPAPRLVLFDDEVQSACGFASAAVGPFYCPRDQKVYIDLSFFRDLDRRFGAPGDFAQAYVIAHEVGHHIQNVLGVLSPGSAGLSRAAANAQSVQQELQADCLAGAWGHSAGGRRYLEEGDAEEGLRAAAAIGDDRLQRASQGRVVPESFTHGSSGQRVDALRRGLSQGSLSACGIALR
jgi:predicted metalloprotease